MGEILQVKKYPDKILLYKSEPIEKITDEEVRLFENMLCTMRHFSGIGLAAPQIGLAFRLIAADLGEGSLLLANPEVIKVTGKDKMQEGCLSVPGALVDIERPSEIIVKGLNEKGKIIEVKAKGLLARVLLHEIDHLNGKLIVHHMNFLERFKFKLCLNKSCKN